MKKRSLLVAALIWAGALLFGETGYTGLQWGESEYSVRMKKYLQGPDPFNEEVGLNSFLFEEKAILGERTKVYYDVLYFGLYSIFYVIDANKTAELKTKFSNQIAEYYGDYTVKYNDQELLENHKIETWPEDKQKKYIDTYTVDWVSTCATQMDYYPNTISREFDYKDKATAATTVYIYDYNDDTRVYIFENIIEGKTVVVYAHHEQDF